MDVLVLGGTGAMGIPLVDKLSSDKKNHIYVTSRSEREDKANVTYIVGNAKDEAFLYSLLDREYDAIVDFMVYDTWELERRLIKLLDSSKHYIFFSSARCYAESRDRITENSLRLVDSCIDSEYLSTDEYGLAKGREENLLFKSEKKNWTIIRPYITYNSQRIQLGVYEKENWLMRALQGRTIVMPRDIASKKTALTYGPDVSGAIIELIGNEKAFAEAFHITTAESHTWEDILEFYCDTIHKLTGERPKVLYIEDSKGLQKVWNKWQIIYDRLYNREFDNKKIENIRGVYEYMPTYEGLEKCLVEFLNNPTWLTFNWSYEGWSDKQTGEFTPLSEIVGIKNKIRYLKWRFLCN